MSVKPRDLFIAAAVAAGLYFAGVPAGTLLWMFALAYMASMHLGGHGGHGGHRSADPPTPSETLDPDVPAPPVEHHGQR